MSWTILVGLTALVFVLPGASARTPTLFVAPNGSDGAQCSSGEPCKSFAAAYLRAAPGSTIVVAGGTYPRQYVAGNKPSSNPIRIEMRPGDQASIQGDLDVTASSVRITGPMRINGTVDVGNPSGATITRDVRLSGLVTQGSFIENVHGLHFADIDFAGLPGHEIVMIGAYPTSHDVVFDRVKIHGNIPTDVSTHLECVFVTAVDGLVFRNSEFRDCGYFDVLIGLCCGARQQPANVVFENNFFGTSRCFKGVGDCGADGKAPYSMMLGTTITGNSRIVGNVFESGPGSQAPLDRVFTSLAASDNQGDAPSAWKVRTRITATVARAGKVVQMHGQVQPAHPGSLVVTYFGSIAGKLQPLSRKSVGLTAEGGYATSFSRRSNVSRCSATIRLAGAQNARVPSRTVGFAC